VTLSGEIEIDGSYLLGGRVKPANFKDERRGRRFADNQTDKHRCVVVMRQHGDRTVTEAGKSELKAVPAIVGALVVVGLGVMSAASHTKRRNPPVSPPNS
jgi:hypothetical protein